MPEEGVAEVTITKAIYDQLCEDSDILNCLRNGGVDNWSGYDWAMKEYWKDKE